MAEGESVRVAVRVRPFNQREKDRNARLCIRMDGHQTTIINPDGGKEKKFTFDFSYWSHDGATERPDGYNECGGPGKGTDGATYADQGAVFQDLGKGVLNNAYEGFNSCLFAYGQTGSGKSYSMVGYGANKGIVPVSCDAIFKKIDENKAGPDADKFQYQVTIQMLEIYNEQVRDLFARSNPSGGLKVRMNPKSGVEVVGLTEWPVGSYAEIDERIETATKNRTVAATQMNATSSRAHTVVTITYTQLELNAKGPGKHSEKKAKINLVDLAGSERAESTGATGDRLKEGAAINLSLTMLGNVITALAEKSNNPNKKVLVPYRDSKLTCILQDALGGNAKTIMICALSPADINYEETVGTLRYADRAKQIKNKPKVNLDPTEVLIQQLKEENERLKKMGGGGMGGGEGMTEAEKEAMRKQMEEEMQAKMEENMRALEEMNKGWEQKLKEAQAMAVDEAESSNSEAKRREKEAHILNIHEDVVLSKAICYFFPRDEVTTFGNRNSTGSEEIRLGGPSIRPDHCFVKSEGDALTLNVREGCKVTLNGEEVTGEMPIHHNDRLALGTNYFFVVVNPPEAATPPEEGWANVDWDFTQREIARAQGLSVDVDWSNMTEEEKRRALLNDELVQVMPRVGEANSLSQELQKGISFQTKIEQSVSVGVSNSGVGSTVMVHVTNRNTGLEYLWGKQKFINRVFLMREMYEKFSEGELDLATVPSEEDPFWDPVEFMSMGYSTVFLKPLAYCLRIEDDYAIYCDAKQDGILHVQLDPCRPDGSIIQDEDEDEDSPYLDVDAPKDLLGKRLDILVSVKYARGLNSKFCREVYCEFDMPRAPNADSNDGKYTTPTQVGTTNPEFNFVRQITWSSVDNDTIHFLETGSAYFNVWGMQDDSKAAGGGGGGAGGKRKMVPIAELETALNDVAKSEHERKRGIDILERLSDLGEQAAVDKEASERFLLEVANTMAEAGVDVSKLMELAQTVGELRPAAAAVDAVAVSAMAPGASAVANTVFGHEEEEEEDPDAEHVVVPAAASGMAGYSASKAMAGLEEGGGGDGEQGQGDKAERARLEERVNELEADVAAKEAKISELEAAAGSGGSADKQGGDAESEGKYQQAVAELERVKAANEEALKAVEDNVRAEREGGQGALMMMEQAVRVLESALEGVESAAGRVSGASSRRGSFKFTGSGVFNRLESGPGLGKEVVDDAGAALEKVAQANQDKVSEAQAEVASLREKLQESDAAGAEHRAVIEGLKERHAIAEQKEESASRERDAAQKERDVLREEVTRLKAQIELSRHEAKGDAAKQQSKSGGCTVQ